jgi:uncharacterized protein (TIGR02099 family)
MPPVKIIDSAKRALLGFLSYPPHRLAGRAILLLATMVYFFFALAIIVLRYQVLPHIEDYRADIEQAASFGLGRRVTIASIEADWRGLNPYLALHNVAVYDEDNRPALQLGLVESTLSWSSLWHLGVRQQSLVLWRPSVVIRRDRFGQIYVAGIPLAKSDAGDGRAANCLLGQHEIGVRDAAMTWIDEQRGAPELALEHVEFQLDNSGSRHRFALRAQPPREHASLLDLRGDVYGDDPQDFSKWRGQVYANLAYADLAAWHAWVDYPLDLRQGRGGLRLWAEFKGQELRALTADVGLADVVARLGEQQRTLELQRLQGRFQYASTDTGYSVSGSGATLRTSAGIAMEQADFGLRVSNAKAREGGEVHANNVDLRGLAQLTEFLPLDRALSDALTKYAPRGKVYELTWNWDGPAGKPQKYALQSRFSDLGVDAADATPGFSGLSGSVKADAAGGSLRLDARNAVIDLPMVFEDPRLTLDTLNGEVNWRLPAGGVQSGVQSGVQVEIERLAFANSDAAGTASGSYRAVAGGPGIVDLNAHLTRAEARQAARYMPAKLMHTREWLARAIQAGESQDVRLKLKGDLAHFPFPEDKDGIFQITAEVTGGKLEYQEAWPAIDGINCELDFHGRRMDIAASQGAILGTRLGRTKVEIADMLVKEKSLSIAGTAEGPTAEFLRFIDVSPLARITDDFSHDMRAVGNGKLALKLVLPLPAGGKPKIAGSFQFLGNQLVAEPSLPPFAQLNGRLDFTESGVTARNITANFLGGPTTISANTRPDAGANIITVAAQGTANMQSLSRALDYAWLKSLAGNTPWRASIVVRKRAVDVNFDSTLAGISSDLPEPLKKAAADALPLKVERHVTPLDAARTPAALPTDNVREPVTARQEAWVVSLGKLVSAKWMTQSGPAGSEIQRAGFAFNEVAQLPARGVVVSGGMPVLDVDQWRDLLPVGGVGSREVKVNLKLGALDALGRRFNDVDFQTAFADNTWHSSIKSREMEGDIDWQPRGQGKLMARLKQFTLPEASPHARELAQQHPGASDDTSHKDLPELDLTADSFVLHEKSLGKLTLVADNVGRDWNIKNLQIASPDGSLTAKGVWQNYSAQPHTELNLHLDASDTGNLLGRMGYPGSMRHGTATLDGNLSWSGSPQSIDYPSLSGSFSVDAKKGQFSKVDPGIGKLLGILSLQSLSRRLSLDFDDVFRDGFAFDDIAGKVDIARGVMVTKNLTIDGPSAKVQISGTTNLVSETQDLRVNVLPIIGDTASLVTTIFNPIIGLGTLVVNRLFNNPIGRALAYEYHVTGTWTEPKVEKLSGPQRRSMDAQNNPPPPAAPAAPSFQAPPPVPLSPTAQQGAKP